MGAHCHRETLMRHSMCDSALRTAARTRQQQPDESSMSAETGAGVRLDARSLFLCETWEGLGDRPRESGTTPRHGATSRSNLGLHARSGDQRHASRTKWSVEASSPERSAAEAVPSTLCGSWCSSKVPWRNNLTHRERRIAPLAVCRDRRQGGALPRSRQAASGDAAALEWTGYSCTGPKHIGVSSARRCYLQRSN